MNERNKCIIATHLQHRTLQQLRDQAGEFLGLHAKVLDEGEEHKQSSIHRQMFIDRMRTILNGLE